MLITASILITTALILLWIAGRQRGKSGIPAGRIIYADTELWKPTEEPLYDRTLMLTGKPDYLIKRADYVIPVEVKSSKVTEAPYDSHIFQLAAYCLLIQKVMGKRPPYGILHYPNKTYAIDFTSELEATIQRLISEIRSQASRAELNRSHASPSRCNRCGYKNVCDQKL